MRHNTKHRVMTAVLATALVGSFGTWGFAEKVSAAEEANYYYELREVRTETYYAEPDISTYSYDYDAKTMYIENNAWALFNEGIDVPLASNVMTNENQDMLAAGANEEIQFAHCPLLQDGIITHIEAVSPYSVFTYDFEAEDGKVVSFTKNIYDTQSGVAGSVLASVTMDYSYTEAGDVQFILCMNEPDYFAEEMPTYCNYSFEYTPDGRLYAFKQVFKGAYEGDTGSARDIYISDKDGKIDQITKDDGPYYSYTMAYDGETVINMVYLDKTSGGQTLITYEYDENGYMIGSSQKTPGENEYQMRTFYEYEETDMPVVEAAQTDDDKDIDTSSAGDEKPAADMSAEDVSAETGENALEGLYMFQELTGDVPDSSRSLAGLWYGTYGYRFVADGTVVYGMYGQYEEGTYAYANEQTPLPIDPNGSYTEYLVQSNESDARPNKVWVSDEKVYLEIEYDGHTYYHCFGKEAVNMITGPELNVESGEYMIGTVYESDDMLVTGDDVVIKTDQNGVQWIWVYYTVTNKTNSGRMGSDFVDTSFYRDGEELSNEATAPAWTEEQYAELQAHDKSLVGFYNGESVQFIDYMILEDSDKPVEVYVIDNDWHDANYGEKIVEVPAAQ